MAFDAMKCAVFILNAIYEGSVNGVNRHIERFLELACRDNRFVYYYICLSAEAAMLYVREEPLYGESKRITIPLPYHNPKVLSEPGLLSTFSQEVLELLSPLVRKYRRRIIHVHTINLMITALQIRKRFHCSIVSHIHCTPWQYKMDKDYPAYLALLHKASKTGLKPSDVLSVCGEEQAYTQVDCVITVTEKKRIFLQRLFNPKHIICIPNGVPDDYEGITSDNIADRPQCLFVGDASRGKGLKTFLTAIVRSQVANNLQIIVAGRVDPAMRNHLKEKFPTVFIHFTGVLEYEKLKELYRNALFCVVPSFHEQCSYTAIEMMMNAKPIIASATDGLLEMFRNNENSLLVPVIHSTNGIPELDINIFSTCINRLTTDHELRRKLGKNARKTYLQRFTAERMCRHIVSVYDKFIER